MSAAPAHAELNGCEREPVHIPGAVQPHGVLLAIDPRDLTIVAISENAETILGIAPKGLLGGTVAAIAVDRERAGLMESLLRDDVEERNPFELTTPAGRVLTMSAHRYDGRIILECEPWNAAPELERTYVYNRVRGSLVRLQSTASLRDLCEQAAREIRGLAGFDRVIIYAFQPDWSGEVVAEECVDGAPRYLGLRFPASDIPSQARALYASCRLRTLPTATYTPACLLGLAGDRPVDLTHANLRSISPVHLEYMRNMGVTASLGISLMDGDRLWGLVTCNHESGDRFIPYDVRTACSLVGEVVSSLIGKKAGIDFAEGRAALLQTQSQLVQYVVQDSDVVRGLTQHSPSIVDVTQSAGAVLVYQDELHLVGATPPREAIAELVAWIGKQPTDLFVAESLPDAYPPSLAWKDVGCGLVASRISFHESSVVRGQSWVLWFRPEVIQTVTWGGDPTKHATVDDDARLHPRKSFERWREDVHLKSVPFTPAALDAARSFTASLTDVILEIEASRQIQEKAALLDASNRELRCQIEENDRVSRALQARTAQLRQRESSLQLVLDATGDGLISVGLDGLLLAERSRGFDQAFTVPPGGGYIWNVLLGHDREAEGELAFMWKQLTSGRIPFEVAVDQMCRELTHDGRQFEVGYRAVRETGELSGVLVKLEDVTERAAARAAVREAEENQAILACVLRDARGFGRTLGDLGTLAKTACSGCPPVEAARALHTLKGNAAMLGLTALAERCDDVEDAMANRGADIVVSAADLEPIEDELARVTGRVHDLVGDAVFERVEIPLRDLRGAIRALESGGEDSRVLAELERWTLEPATRRLGKLAERARRLARQLGKDVEVVVSADNVRVDGEAFEPLWSALAHAVTNAVDHGIEPAAARVAQGKPPRGRIVLSADEARAGWLTIVVEDDGAGIDLDAVRVATERRGLSCTTRAEALEALFVDTVSTRSDITSTSGRGVGLSALRETCRALGCSVDLETEARVGTKLRVLVPSSSRRSEGPVASARLVG